MRKLLITILSLAFLSANAQTADEIVGKFNAAMGGLDGFNAIKTLKITGNVSVQGTDLPLTVQIINGKAMRNDVSFMGQSITNCYKDGKGWKVNPLAGVTTATDVSGSELNEFKALSMLASPLMDYKSRGHSIELQGQEDVEGIKTYKIKLTTKEDGTPITYFISTSDYMLIKTITIRQMQGQDMDVETFFSNVKEFNGLKFYLTRTLKIDGQEFQEITYSNLEFDKPIDEKIYDKQ